MIRFLNLKNQICEGSNDFAFYDTTTNSILEFESYFGVKETGDTRPFSRFIGLIPEDYFSTKP
jgi:hypothetical protein